MTAAIRRRLAGDRGFTLIELMVSMGVLSVVMVVTLTALLSVYRGVNQTEGISFARDQIANSFRKFDREVRYATWIAPPGQVGTRWYVEFATPVGCRQLIYDNGTLTMATWTAPGTPSPGSTIASGLSLISGVAPFTLYPAHSRPYATADAGTSGVGASFSPEHAQLRVRFNATIGTVTSAYDTVWTAMNTSFLTSALNGCSAGRPTS